MRLEFVVSLRVDEDTREITTHISQPGRPGLEFDGVEGLEMELLERVWSELKEGQ